MLRKLFIVLAGFLYLGTPASATDSLTLTSRSPPEFQDVKCSLDRLERLMFLGRKHFYFQTRWNHFAGRMFIRARLLEDRLLELAGGANGQIGSVNEADRTETIEKLQAERERLLGLARGAYRNAAHHAAIVEDIEKEVEKMIHRFRCLGSIVL